jgi:LacI family transcriptional regulator
MSSTIYDVAHKAGVSISTVSRVLNNNPSVLEETRQKVLKVISDMEFKPNPIARGLVVKQTNIIELFFSWFSPECDFRSHWYVEMLNGVNEVVQKNKFGLLVNTVAGVADPDEVFRRIFHHAVDGILLVSPYLEEKDILRVLDRRIPTVLIGHRMENLGVDFVDGDNLNAAGQVVDYLADLGHRRIACITGPAKGSVDSADRLRGFESAMARRNLTFPALYKEDGGFTRHAGYLAMQRLLLLPQRPTAVFAFDDSMALGAWKAVQEAGLTVGRDLSLVGFDDIPEASQAPFSLTTMRQDFRGLSVQATQILVEKIQQPGNWTPRRILIPTQLVVRGSCGPAKD